MEHAEATINHFLVEVFNEILKTEENCLTEASCRGLSLRELHVIEAVCNAEDSQADDRATAIAERLRVTAGSLTTAVAILEKKGFLTRTRDQRDRRVVHLQATETGRAANACHQRFHEEMVADILHILSVEEQVVLLRALGGVTAFFRDKYAKARGPDKAGSAPGTP